VRAANAAFLVVLLVGASLLSYGFVFGSSPSVIYYLDVEPTDEEPANADMVDIEELEPPVREAFLRQVEEGGSAEIGTEEPTNVPRYVAHKGQRYELDVSHADPGGNPALTVAVLTGVPLVALAVVGRLGYAVWERYQISSNP